jgi:hypothetical protein
MRLSGYSFGDVGNEMYRQARPPRQEHEHRDWKGYARRMVWYAFGAAGDIDIAAFSPYRNRLRVSMPKRNRLKRHGRESRKNHEEKRRDTGCVDDKRLTGKKCMLYMTVAYSSVTAYCLGN